MADTIARLIFEADTSQLSQAQKVLEGLTNTSKDAEKNKQKEIKTQKDSTKVTKDDTSAKTENEKQTKKNSKASEGLSTTFRNASNATATLLGPLNGLSGRLSFIATGLNRVGITGVVLGFTLTKLGQEVIQGVQAFAEFEKQVARIDSLLRATGRTAEFTSDQLNQLAVDLGEVTLASAAGARDAIGQLLTFTNVSTEVFEEALFQAQNLSAVMGRDLGSSVQSLGRLLDAPISNFGALTRAGIQFNAAEKDIIRSLVVANRELEAQEFILRKVRNGMGDAAKDEANTLSGKFDTFAERAGRLAENLGKIAVRFFPITQAVDGLNFVLSSINKVLDQIKSREEILSILAPEGNAGARRRSRRTGTDELPANDESLSSPTVIDIRATNANLPKPKIQTIAQREDIIQEQLLQAQLLDLKQEGFEAEHQMELEAANLRFQSKVQQAQLDFELEVKNNEHRREALLAERDFRVQIAAEERDQELQAKAEQFAVLEQMELDKENKLNDIQAKGAKKGLSIVAGALKRKLGDSKKGAIAAVAIDAAMSAANILVSGAAEAQGIKASAAIAARGLPIGKREVYIAKGKVQAAEAMAKAKALAAATAATTFATGALGVAVGGGGGGGAVAASTAAESASVQPAANDPVIQPPQVINVSVDGSIDPSGARRIVEAINEATEDGIEINALVGT